MNHQANDFVGDSQSKVDVDEAASVPVVGQPTSRRRFLKRALIGSTAIGAATFGYAWRLEPHWIDVVHREMAIKHLPQNLVGKRLIQISDMHVGPVVDDDYLIGAMKTVNGLKPDIIALTGDLVSYHSQKQYAQSAHVLSFLEAPSIAKVAIMGNHEYGYQFTDADIADGFHDVLERSRFTALRNCSTDIAGLRVIGVDDLWSPQFELERSLAEFDRTWASLVLCHNPDAVDLDGWNGDDGWILSGHTHGGQCQIPGLTPPILPVKNKRYAAGAVFLPDGRKLFVNRGLGYLRRLRFCTRPEITVFSLATS